MLLRQIQDKDQKHFKEQIKQKIKDPMSVILIK